MKVLKRNSFLHFSDWMPGGLPFPTLLGMLPGVEAGVSAMMKSQMAALDVPPVDEFIEMIVAGGGTQIIFT